MNELARSRDGLVHCAWRSCCSSAGMVSTAGRRPVQSVRGFDGKTITVAGLGIKKLLPSGEDGARARIKRFNDTNEIKGIKIDYKEFADDKQDPATALSEARRLVTQVGVFAIVGDISANNPGQYFAQQHVPYFGGGFDTTYCSNKPSTSLWGFSYGGCIAAGGPVVRDRHLPRDCTSTSARSYGQEAPDDGASSSATTTSLGRTGRRSSRSRPRAPASRWSTCRTRCRRPRSPTTRPYVQAVLKGDNGKPPDAIVLYAAPRSASTCGSCSRPTASRASSSHGLYPDALVKRRPEARWSTARTCPRSRTRRGSSR